MKQSGPCLRASESSEDNHLIEDLLEYCISLK